MAEVHFRRKSSPRKTFPYGGSPCRRHFRTAAVAAGLGAESNGSYRRIIPSQPAAFSAVEHSQPVASVHFCAFNRRYIRVKIYKYERCTKVKDLFSSQFPSFPLISAIIIRVCPFVFTKKIIVK